MTEIAPPPAAAPAAADAAAPMSRMLRWLAAGVAVAIALIAGTTGLAFRENRNEHQERAAVAAENLARVLEQTVAAVIDKVDLALRAAAIDAEKRFAAGAADAPGITGLLAQHKALVPELHSLRIAGPDGIVRFGPGVADGAPVSIADRDFFIRLRDDPKAGLVVSEPVFARISQTWVIVVARRLNRPDGTLAGVIYANIATERLQRLFADLKLGSHGTVSLRTTDLRLVARHPAPRNMVNTVGSSAVSAQLRKAVLSASEAGVYVAAAPFDGIERTNAYRRLARYPIYLVVGLASEDYEAAWREDAWRDGSLAALAIMLTLLAAWLVRRSWRQQAAAADALARESHRHRALLRTASDGIHVLDAEGRVLEVSDSFCRLLGYERDQLLRMQVAQWDAQWSAAELREILARLVASKSGSMFETRHRHRDGHVFDVEINVTCIELDGTTVLYASARDITERKRAEAALRASELRQRRVIDGSDQAIWDWDLVANDFSTSARFATMLGYAPGELDVSVANWPAIVEAGDLERAQASIARHLAGETPAHEVEVRCRTKAGHWHWVLTRGRIVERDADGRPLIMSGTFTDISERKRSELILERAKAEAEKANRDKSRFLAAASHDLRQPLSALSLYVGALERRVTADGEKVIASIQNCVDSLSELLTDLLDVSKLEAGVVAPKRSTFAVGEVLDNLFSVHAGEARLKGLELRRRASPAIAHTDPVLLRRILGNFVANAIRYTEHGGVLVACRRRHGKLWAEVWDTGIGVPADKTEIIFEAFTQLDNDTRNRGSGLGLAIVAKTAKLLGLEIRVRSRPGRGSMFAIELPPGGAPALAAATALPAAGALRIGVVDDNATLLNALELTLAAAGHEVVAATSGRELLARLAGRRPEIVVSDYRLKGTETGFEVIAAVRAAFGDALPALLITGDTDPALIRCMADRGIAVHYKPLRPDALLAAIGACIARRRRTEQPQTPSVIH